MKNSKTIKKLIIILLLSLVIYSSFNIIKYFINDYQTNKSISFNKEILDQNLTNNSSNNNDNIKQNNENILNIFKNKYENNDIFSIIKVSGTNIEHPVVQGNDNTFYLNHNLNKKPNLMGTIFLDYENSNKLTDNNSIIYGHDIKNGFSELKKFLNQDFIEKHNTISIYLEDEIKNYNIISVYVTTIDDNYIDTSVDKNSFLNKILDKSIIKNDNNINTTNNILTLSTCANKGEKRLVLHAIEI